jgi:hypothetical protein
MATTKTKADLEAKISDSQDENQELQDQLDAIADIVGGDTEEEEDETGDNETGDDDEEADQDGTDLD